MQWAFGECVLDLERRELHRDGAPVQIRSKVFEVLRYLIEQRDRVVSRDDLLSHAWPGLMVSDATLSNCIAEVRRAIGDDATEPRFIKTLRGQGFRFVGEVEERGQRGASIDGAHTRPAMPSGDELTVAVLPFVNANESPELAFLAGGLAEDIVTALSRFKAFSVIAYSSSQQFQGPDIPQIGAALEADYVLQGSVRHAGDRFRATVRLIHAASNTQVWAEHYDGRNEDLFALEDEISQQIVSKIAPEIDQAEMRRAARLSRSDLKAQEMAWRARAMLHEARAEGDAELYREGMALAEEAASFDPQCRQAWWTIAFANYALAYGRQGSDPGALLTRAREAAEKLRALDRNDHSAYMALGWISYIEQDLDNAMAYLEQALELNPSCTMTLMLIGTISTASGRAEAGYDYLKQAMRLSPRDTFLGFMLAAQAHTCFALERFAEGVEMARRAIQREPHAPANHMVLAACLVETGEIAGAGEAIRAQRRINADYLAMYLEGRRLPFKEATMSERYRAALRRAVQAADALPA